MADVEFKSDLNKLNFAFVLYFITVGFSLLFITILLILKFNKLAFYLSLTFLGLFLLFLFVFWIFYHNDSGVIEQKKIRKFISENQLNIKEIEELIKENDQKLIFLEKKFENFQSINQSKKSEKINIIKNKIDELPRIYRQKVKDQLKNYQKHFVVNGLKNKKIRYASIPSIVEFQKQRIISSGYHNAYDIYYADDLFTVRGISVENLTKLSVWAKAIHKDLIDKKPSSLPEEFLRVLREEYAQKSKDFQSKIDKIKFDKNNEVSSEEINVNRQFSSLKSQNDRFQDQKNFLNEQINNATRTIKSNQISFAHYLLKSSQNILNVHGFLSIIIGSIIFLLAPLFLIGFSATSLDLINKGQITTSPAEVFLTNEILPSYTKLITSTITSTSTYTLTATPSSTLTSTITTTQTASQTFTLTISPTFTQTRTSTPRPLSTIRPTDTRWPTATEGPTSPPDGGGGGGGGGGGDDGGNNCDPSYPTVCIPSPPPDLNCDDIFYTDFTVIGDDPHGFDGDNDGIGCET